MSQVEARDYRDYRMARAMSCWSVARAAAHPAVCSAGGWRYVQFATHGAGARRQCPSFRQTIAQAYQTRCPVAASRSSSSSVSASAPLFTCQQEAPAATWTATHATSRRDAPALIAAWRITPAPSA
jgi:hypothetical protein